MRLFLKTLVIISLTLLLFFVGSFSFLEWNASKNKFYLIPSDKTSIILGHSHAACAFDDKIIKGFYNLSQNMEGYPYSYFKIKKILENNTHIENVFIEYTNNQITPWAIDRISGRYMKFNMERTLPILNKRFAVKTLLHSLSFSDAIGSLLASYKKNIDFIINDNNSYIEYAWHTNTTSDHVFKGDTSQQKHDFKDADAFQNIYQVQQENLNYLFKLKRLCKQNKVRLVLVRSPAPSYSSSANEFILHHIKDTFFSETPFLDFSKFSLRLNQFADEQHINTSGRNTFSQYFNDSILAKGFTENLLH